MRRKHKTTNNDNLIISILSLVIATVAFLTYSFGQDEVFLKEMKGTVNHYEYNERGYKSRPSFILEVNKERFVITSITLSAFNVEKFKKEVRIGDELLIDYDQDKIVFQIKKKDASFIDSDKVKVLISENSYLGLILGIVFSIFSIILLIRFFKTS